MNPLTFDNDADETTNEEYSAFVEWLTELTAEEFRQAKANTIEQRKVLCCYYKRGDLANLSIGELIDFLAVSYPSVMDKAGYIYEETAKVMEISDHLPQEEIHAINLPERSAEQ